MSNCNGSDFVPSVVGKSKGGGCSSVFSMFYDHAVLITRLPLKISPLNGTFLRLKCSFIFLLPHRCCRMLEYGEYKGYLYGTSIDAVRTVLDEGKICVIDLEPQVSCKGPGNLDSLSPRRKNNSLYVLELLEQCQLLCLVFHSSSWCLLIIDHSLHGSWWGDTTVTSMYRSVQFICFQVSSCIIRWNSREMSFHTCLKQGLFFHVETVAWDFLLLLQALLVESSVLPLAISEHPLVKAATIKVIEQKQGLYHASISLQK